MTQASSVDWNLYRSFLAVMREGSLSAAARQLGLTQPSLGRHIDALESALGLSLFTRSQHGLTPTPKAQELQAAAQAMDSASRLAQRLAASSAQDERATVRLSVSQLMGGEVLPELLTQYRQLHPQVSIELVLNNQTEDLLRRDADIAVRMIRPTQQTLLAKRLGQVDIGLFAHQRYVKAHGMPQSLLELTQHTLIGSDQDPSVAQMAKRHGFAIDREWFALRCDNDLAQLAALRAGFGIGGCQLGIAKRDGQLLPVLHDHLMFSLEMWLVMHSGLRNNHGVMSLFKFLSIKLKEYARTSLR